MERVPLEAPGNDKNCKGNKRIMRMEWNHYINRNNECQGQVIIINADGPSYSAEELDTVLPTLPVTPQPRRIKLRTGSAPGLLQIADAMGRIQSRKGGDGTYGDYSNIRWGLKEAFIAAGADEDLAIQLGEAHSPSAECDWDVEQIARSVYEQISAGTLIH